MVSVCDCLIGRFMGLNSAEGMDVGLLCSLCDMQVAAYVMV